MIKNKFHFLLAVLALSFIPLVSFAEGCPVNQKADANLIIYGYQSTDTKLLIDIFEATEQYPQELVFRTSSLSQGCLRIGSMTSEKWVKTIEGLQEDAKLQKYLNTSIIVASTIGFYGAGRLMVAREGGNRAARSFLNSRSNPTLVSIYAAGALPYTAQNIVAGGTYKIYEYLARRFAYSRTFKVMDKGIERVLVEGGLAAGGLPTGAAMGWGITWLKDNVFGQNEEQILKNLSTVAAEFKKKEGAQPIQIQIEDFSAFHGDMTRIIMNSYSQ